MIRLVRDMMTTGLVTVEPSPPFEEVDDRSTGVLTTPWLRP